MKFSINIDNQNLNVKLIKKSRIKHTYLTLKDSKNLEVKGGRFLTIEDAQSFINQKKQWLRKSILKLQIREKNREKNYYLGEIIEEISEEKLDEFYRQKAKEMLPSLVEKHAHRMNLFPSKLSFRKNKTRFGSCSVKNAISLNILLMKYNIEVIEYVIIHELAHIKYKNHSRDFWSLVELYCPDYKNLDKALKIF